MFSKVCNLINKSGQIYWRFIASPEEYARHLGVKIGKNCLIATHNWPSELSSWGSNNEAQALYCGLYECA